MELNKTRYDLTLGGMFCGGIGIGFLFGARLDPLADPSLHYILGAVFVVIGFILLIASRIIK